MLRTREHPQTSDLHYDLIAVKNERYPQLKSLWPFRVVIPVGRLEARWRSGCHVYQLFVREKQEKQVIFWDAPCFCHWQHHAMQAAESSGMPSHSCSWAIYIAGSICHKYKLTLLDITLRPPRRLQLANWPTARRASHILRKWHPTFDGTVCFTQSYPNTPIILYLRTNRVIPLEYLGYCGWSISAIPMEYLG